MGKILIFEILGVILLVDKIQKWAEGGLCRPRQTILQIETILKKSTRPPNSLQNLLFDHCEHFDIFGGVGFV